MEQRKRKKPLTPAQRQKNARERAKSWRQELADRGMVEVPLVIKQTQLDALNRYARLTRIWPNAPGDGLSGKELLLRLSQPSIKRFEAQFAKLMETHGDVFSNLETLRDLSPHLSDKQFKANKKVDHLWHQYMSEGDPAKAEKLLAEHARLMAELDSQWPDPSR